MIGDFKIFITLFGKNIVDWVKIAKNYPFIDGFELYCREDIIFLKQQENILKELKNNYEFSLHAPYVNLSFPPFNQNLYEKVLIIFKKTVDFAEKWQVKNIVLHGDYNYLFFIRENFTHIFKKKLITFIEKLGLNNKNLSLSFENVFETKSKYFFNYIRGIRSIYDFHYCIDTGHLNFISIEKLEQWLNYFDNNLKEMHIHDNDSTFDEHLYPGGGNFNFHKLFTYLIKKDIYPQLTLELHNIKHLTIGIENLKKYLEEAYEKNSI